MPMPNRDWADNKILWATNIESPVEMSSYGFLLIDILPSVN